MESIRDAGTGEPNEPITGGRGMVTPEVVEGGDGTVSLWDHSYIK